MLMVCGFQQIMVSTCSVWIPFGPFFKFRDTHQVLSFPGRVGDGDWACCIALHLQCVDVFVFAPTHVLLLPFLLTTPHPQQKKTYLSPTNTHAPPRTRSHNKQKRLPMLMDGGTPGECLDRKRGLSKRAHSGRHRFLRRHMQHMDGRTRYQHQDRVHFQCPAYLEQCFVFSLLAFLHFSVFFGDGEGGFMMAFRGRTYTIPPALHRRVLLNALTSGGSRLGVGRREWGPPFCFVGKGTCIQTGSCYNLYVYRTTASMAKRLFQELLILPQPFAYHLYHTNCLSSPSDAIKQSPMTFRHLTLSFSLSIGLHHTAHRHTRAHALPESHKTTT